MISCGLMVQCIVVNVVDCDILLGCWSKLFNFSWAICQSMAREWATSGVPERMGIYGNLHYFEGIFFFYHLVLIWFWKFSLIWWSWHVFHWFGHDKIWNLNIFYHPITAVIFGCQDPHSGRCILCSIHVIRFNGLQRVPALRVFWDLEKTVLHETRVSGTVLWSPTNANSPTYTYISQKLW